MWEYWAGDDGVVAILLGGDPGDLPTEDLSRVVAILLGGDPGDLPDALGPLYRRDDRADLVAAMRVFNKMGLLQAKGSGPVEVSSGGTSGEGDSERTIDDRPASMPLPSQSILLRELEDDDASVVPPAGTSSRPTRSSRGARVESVCHSVCVRACLPKAQG
ncbi:hypothetical protein D1007_24632 [Hordeum vulgare]|nr:hypothetical protein D1007_24632 [Hordeum vulgare]